MTDTATLAAVTHELRRLSRPSTQIWSEPTRDVRTAAVAVYWAGDLVFEALVTPGALRREVLHAVDQKLALGPSRPRALGTAAFRIASVEPGTHGYAYVVSLVTEAEGLR